MDEGVVFHDGFSYKTRRRTVTTRYLVCTKDRRFGCRASGKVSNGEVTVMNAHHNHPREARYQEAEAFRAQLREASVTQRGTLKFIYDRVATRHPEGALHVPYNSVRSSMWRWKQATTPNVPTTLPELAEILQTGEWPRYDSCTNGPFFSGTTAAGAHRAVVFANEDFIRNFGDSMYNFMDGTFKAVPRQPAFAQIFTIFATCMDHAFPVIHIFMERRTKALYDAVFLYIRQAFPSLLNRTIITDYEAALVESLRENYPQASLRGCFFHYCQAVMRKARTLGVMRAVEENPHGKALLRKYYALALVPADRMEEAFEFLQDEQLREAFQDLRNYIRRQWMDRVTPHHFSVFRERHRTNNVMEAYHRRLNGRLVRHPGIWDLMETLIDIQNIAILELQQLEQQGRVFRVAKRNEVFDRRLTQAWDKLADGRFNLQDFFRQAVHFMENFDVQLQEWNQDVPPEEVEEFPINFPNLFDPPVPQQHIPNPPLPPLPSRSPSPLPDFNISNPVRPTLPLNLPNPPRSPSPLPDFNISNPGRPTLPLNLPNPPRSPSPLPDFNISNPGRPTLPLNLPNPPRSPSPLPDFNISNPVRPTLPLNLPSPPRSPSPLPDFNISNPGRPTLPLNLPNPPHSHSSFFPPRLPSPEFNFPIWNLPSPPLPPRTPPSPEVPGQGQGLDEDGSENEPFFFNNEENPWEPDRPTTQHQEETNSLLLCKVCLTNVVQYVLHCGHAFCGNCTSRVFNEAAARCPVCRIVINKSLRPLALFL